VRRELKAYDPELVRKKEVVALSKCDSADPATIEEKSAALQKAARRKPLLLSAVTGMGMEPALYRLTREVAGRTAEPGDEDEEPGWRP
jgi:GTPase